MKLKVTNRCVRENYKYILCSNNIEYILHYCGFGAKYYNAGQFGWNWDCYVIDDEMVILTGYRNFPKCDKYLDVKTISYLENNIKGDDIEERKQSFKSLIYSLLKYDNIIK